MHSPALKDHNWEELLGLQEVTVCGLHRSCFFTFVFAINKKKKKNDECHHNNKVSNVTSLQL